MIGYNLRQSVNINVNRRSYAEPKGYAHIVKTNQENFYGDFKVGHNRS